MNQKLIGVILICIGILLAMFAYYIKSEDDKAIIAYEAEHGGSCYLPDGTCLHEDRDYTKIYVGIFLSASVIILGLYLALFDKTQKLIYDQNEKIANLMQRKDKEKSDDEKFQILLTGLDAEEKQILNLIKNEEGINQATLSYKTDMSKAKLSVVLKDLETKGLIKKEKKGMSNKLYFKGF